MLESTDFTIYLSGGMSNLTELEQTRWRDDLIDTISLSAKTRHYHSRPVFLSPPSYYSFFRHYRQSEREVMEFDLSQVRKSDLIIVNFNDPKSIGTAMELMLARELHIPIIGLNINKNELHPWLEECCTRICYTREELIEHILSFYLYTR